MNQALRKSKDTSEFKSNEISSNASGRKSLLLSPLKNFSFQLLAGKIYPAIKHEQTLSWQKKESKELELCKSSLAAVLVVDKLNIIKLKKQLESLAVQSSEDFNIHIITKAEHEPKLKECVESAGIFVKLTVHRVEQLDFLSIYKHLSQLFEERNFFFLQENTVLHPQALFILLKELKKNKNISLCYFNEVFISPNSSPEFYLRKIFPESRFSFIQRNWLGGSYIISKDALSEVLKREEFSFKKSLSLEKLNHLVANAIIETNYVKSFVPLALSSTEKSRTEILAANSLKEIPIFSSVSSQSLQIVIPFKNQSKITIKCLDSILKQEELENVEITLISNSSEKSELEEVRNYINSSKLKIDLLEYSGHFNFARINNFGASKSTSDYILFLNNDVELVTSTAISKMKSAASLKEIGVVSGSLYYPNEKIQSSGINFAGIRPLNVRDESMFSSLLREVDGVSFAMALMKREVWQNLKGLDEVNCPNGFGDALFCQKVIDNKLKCILSPEVKAYHYESISRGESIEDLELFEMTSSGLKIASEFHSLEAKRQPELIALSGTDYQGEFFDKLVWQIKNRKKLLFIFNQAAKFLVYLKSKLKNHV